MQFSFSYNQLVLATTLLGISLFPVDARAPFQKKDESEFKTFDPAKTAGVQPNGMPSGSGGAYPSGTGTGAAVPTGGDLEAFVYEDNSTKNDTGPLVSVSVLQKPTLKADDPMESGTSRNNSST